jgi:hypothetical protein
MAIAKLSESHPILPRLGWFKITPAPLEVIAILILWSFVDTLGIDLYQRSIRGHLARLPLVAGL